jgi:hypothetical protein
MRAREAIGLGLAICCFSTTGCFIPWRAQEPETREAMSRWLYRAQGYVPVFPPREDVQIGDIWTIPIRADSWRYTTCRVGAPCPLPSS